MERRRHHHVSASAWRGPGSRQQPKTASGVPWTHPELPQVEQHQKVVLGQPELQMVMDEILQARVCHLVSTLLHSEDRRILRKQQCISSE